MGVVLYKKEEDGTITSSVYDVGRFQSALASGNCFLTPDGAESGKDPEQEADGEDVLIYTSAKEAVAAIDGCETAEDLGGLGNLTADCAKWATVKNAYEAKSAEFSE